jgi:4-hydroxy-tetrahydrodipicolinate reductase
MSEPIPVIVTGAAGKMGRQVVKAVASSPDLVLMGAVDRHHLGEDVGEVAGIQALEVPITSDLQSLCALVAQEKQPGVMVDFTHPHSVYENVRTAIAYGVYPVVGTTGLSSDQIQDLAEFCDKASMGCIIAPNFSIGMVLLQQAAIQACRYFDHVEIIELHHNQKADAPSGTALKTAQMLAEMGKTYNASPVTATETVPGVRGGLGPEHIRIHSVRLPGLIAHQEVIFGAPGELYTLRHDTSDRSCYMPGVLLAIRKVRQLKQLVYGLEKILD